MKSTTSTYRISEELRVRLEQASRYLKRGKNWVSRENGLKGESQIMVDKITSIRREAASVDRALAIWLDLRPAK